MRCSVCFVSQVVDRPTQLIFIQGVFHWYPPKKYGESTLTQKVLARFTQINFFVIGTWTSEKKYPVQSSMSQVEIVEDEKVPLSAQVLVEVEHEEIVTTGDTDQQLQCPVLVPPP